MLLDLILPVRCVGCGDWSGPLCAECRPVPRPVSVAGLPVPCVAAGRYEGVLRAAVLAYKERGHRALAGMLGGLLAVAILEVLGSPGPVWLVPVPSTAAAIRRRREDHALRLAREAAAVLRRGGVPARASPVLSLRRTPADSVGLTAAERRANVAGAFAVNRRARAPVVLIDDVVTTGATLGAACEAALGAGARVYGACVVAATPARKTR